MALVRTYVSEELSASIIKVTRIGELGTTLAVTSNQFTLMMEALISSEASFLQVSHDVSSQKTAFFIGVYTSKYNESSTGATQPHEDN
jgi:hypothetical protein